MNSDTKIPYTKPGTSPSRSAPTRATAIAIHGTAARRERRGDGDGEAGAQREAVLVRPAGGGHRVVS
jgi:hypothetical protein